MFSPSEVVFARAQRVLTNSSSINPEKNEPDDRIETSGQFYPAKGPSTYMYSVLGQDTFISPYPDI